MAEQTFVALEFPELIRVIQHYARSTLGQQHLAAMRPETEHARLQTALEEIGQFQELVSVEGACPVEGFPDLEAILGRARVPGSVLVPTDFNEILLVLTLLRRLRRFFETCETRYPLIAQRALALKELPALLKAIQGTISPHGHILDQASEELALIRQEMTATRQKITRHLHRLFGASGYKDAIQDQLISQRNGRYVIPIKSDYKGRVPGIIHDQSHSRATLFVEPLEVVDHNNNLNLLINAEKREEERLLRHLTDILRAYLEPLQANLELLGALDALHAKVLYAADYGCRLPDLTQAGRVTLRGARHPLLLYQARHQPQTAKAAPVDLLLDQERRFLVLSGANTGGKTVTLKTLGLICLMVHCGIPVPVATDSEVCVFQHIFADIGDSQDLAHALSTFSAHIKRVGDILAQLQGRCLVLLDELGTATDPGEGAALAMALVRALLRGGAYGAVTTHFHQIKAFAQVEPGCENVSVLFDVQTQKPLYRLAYGIAGPSNALQIAREWGLPPAIITEAEGYLGREGLEAGRLLAQLQGAQQQVAAQQQQLEEERQSHQADKARLAAAWENLEKEAAKQRDHDRKAIQRSIRQAEAKFKEIFRRLEGQKESWGSLRQEFSQLQGQLREMLPTGPSPQEGEAVLVQPGQKVFLGNLGREAIVTAPADKDNRVEVLVGTVKIKLPITAIKVKGPAGGGLAPAAGRLGSWSAAPVITPMASTSLNIIGLRVEEALPLVDRLLDQAVLNGCQRVDIIHGIGSGRLQSAIRKHLRRHALVKEIHLGESGQGNPGVTVVDIKE